MNEDETHIFKAKYPRYNQAGRIVTFGPYLSNIQKLDAHGAVRYLREQITDTYQTREMRDRQDALRWTKQIMALNAGRRWALERIFTRLDGLLEPEIAIAVVPSHDPFVETHPIRELAQRLAATQDRIDATGCLRRHTKIKRIVFGGPSYRSLHRDTIGLHEPEIITGRNVLLLDDIAKSGASLRACEELLYEAGAGLVQSVALGRVSG